MPHSPPPVARNNGTARVIKTLRPQDPGARRWSAEFGDRLLCVRYRVDAERQRRQTTVERVVDEAPTLASARVGLRIAWAVRSWPRSRVGHGRPRGQAHTPPVTT